VPAGLRRFRRTPAEKPFRARHDSGELTPPGLVGLTELGDRSDQVGAVVAVTTGADPLHVAAVFGFSDGTAVRGATNARELVDGPHATRLPESP
jgi:hypothetical protein